MHLYSVATMEVSKGIFYQHFLKAVHWETINGLLTGMGGVNCSLGSILEEVNCSLSSIFLKSSWVALSVPLLTT